VEADRGQIDQVLNNLIINADQAMPGGGNITVKAENITLPPGDRGAEAPLHALPSGDYVKVMVSDEGQGISKEDLEKNIRPVFHHQTQWKRPGAHHRLFHNQEPQGFITV